MDVTEREMDPDIGSEFFSEQMYYSLSRETRAELSREWTNATVEAGEHEAELRSLAGIPAAGEGA